MALKETLWSMFWYKKQLRRFLLDCGVNQGIMGQLDWNQYKRTIIAQLIDGMSMNPQLYSEELLRVAVAVAKIGDPKWLLNVPDRGKSLYDDAVERINDFAARMNKCLREVNAWNEREPWVLRPTVSYISPLSPYKTRYLEFLTDRNFPVQVPRFPPCTVARLSPGHHVSKQYEHPQPVFPVSCQPKIRYNPIGNNNTHYSGTF